MDQRGYLEAAGQRLTEFGGFVPVDGERLPTLVAEWADLVVERVEPGLITLVAFVPLQAGSLLAAVRDEMAAHLAEVAQAERREVLGLLLLVTEERINREIYDRAQSLIYVSGRVRVVPWFADLGRGRLFGHEGPPFGIDPDLFMLAEPAIERPVSHLSARAQPARRTMPYVTIGLAAIVVLIWGAMTLAGGSLEATESVALLSEWGAAGRPDLLLDEEYWRLLTAGFLHIGIAHLVMNTLSLWWVGQMVEALYGSVRMLIIYLIALVAGSVASLVLGPPVIISAGASGAIFGLLGAALWYQLTGPDRERLKRVPLMMVLGINLVYGLMMYETIDNWNHLGGLVGGFVAAAAVGLPKQPRRLARSLLHGLATLLLVAVSVAAVLGLFKLPGPAQRLAAALIALDEGRYDEAEPGIAEVARRYPDEPQFLLWLAWIDYNQGEVAEAKSRLEQVLQIDPDNPGAKELLRALPSPGGAR